MTEQKEHATGNFFAIDRRAWAVACELGINAAITYLVLARGSGPDQRTTSWSVNAVEKYTGIGRPRAQNAIESLDRVGLVRVIKRGTKPRYCIAPAHEVPRSEDYRLSLDETEQKVFGQLVAGCQKVPQNIARSNEAAIRQWGTRWPRKTAEQLVSKGWARNGEWCHYIPIPYDLEAAATPNWIWLPNSLIDGVSNDLAAPIELVRQTRDPAALRLLIDLYHAQNLASDGGIHWRIIWQEFDRETVGQRGSFTIYGFAPGTISASTDNPVVRPHMTGEVEIIERRRRDRGWPTFGNAWDQLLTLGLVEAVGHLVDADDAEAEIIHPYAVGNGEISERELAAAAHQAAMAMLTPSQQQWAGDRSLRLVPVRAHIKGVQMVGIVRLRYRPKTSMTSAWFARMSQWDEMAAGYNELTAQAAKDARIAHVQYQG